MRRVNPDDRWFRRERATIEAMIEIFCRGQHAARATPCEDCAALRDYAWSRLERCTFGAAKPRCSQCEIHCYRPDMRERIKAVMRYAGPRMLSRHPVMAARHLWHGVAHRLGRGSASANG